MLTIPKRRGCAIAHPILFCRSRPLEHRADTFGVGEHVELFDPDADPCDARIGEAGRADPFGKSLAQIDVSGAGDLADRGNDLLVIDDPPTVVTREGGGGRRDQIDRDPNALFLLTLAPTDADAAH